MLCYLVRHAHAGSRVPGGRDRYRPLSPQGRERAEAMVELFAEIPLDRLLSSPATRCQQTLGPMASAKGLDIEVQAELWEGSSIVECLAELQTVAGAHVMACSHGDMIPSIIDQLAHDGVPISGRGCELGSVWVLQRERGRWVEARYVGPRAHSLV